MQEHGRNGKMRIEIESHVGFTDMIKAKGKGNQTETGQDLVQMIWLRKKERTKSVSKQAGILVSVQSIVGCFVHTYIFFRDELLFGIL
jgi:hypothetical protein